MNRRQKIIVSVTGIILVLLILVGLTYAYFLTKINGNTNDKSISVTTANLEIEYKDNNDIIIGDRIEPGTILPTKVFTVINNGNMNVEYSVGLVNIINTFTNTEDVVYTITCKSYNKDGFSLGTDGTITGTENGTCSGVDETEFPTLNSYIVTNNIDVNIVHAYTMTVTYKETGIDQSIDMNKELSAKIDIFDPKSLTIQGNVTNSSDNDYVVIHSKEQESQILNGNYRFIGITPDKHTITVKNRNTTDTKSTTLDVEKGTPNVSGSKIIYDEDKNVADMGISISDSTLELNTKSVDNQLDLEIIKWKNSDNDMSVKNFILEMQRKGIISNIDIYDGDYVPVPKNKLNMIADNELALYIKRSNKFVEISKVDIQRGKYDGQEVKFDLVAETLLDSNDFDNFNSENDNSEIIKLDKNGLEIMPKNYIPNYTTYDYMCNNFYDSYGTICGRYENDIISFNMKKQLQNNNVKLINNIKSLINLNDGSPIIRKDEFLISNHNLTISKDFYIEYNPELINPSNEEYQKLLATKAYTKLYLDNIDGTAAEAIEITIENENEVLYNGLMSNFTREKSNVIVKLNVMQRKNYNVFIKFIGYVDYGF